MPDNMKLAYSQEVWTHFANISLDHLQPLLIFSSINERTETIKALLAKKSQEMVNFDAKSQRGKEHKF